MNKAEQEWSHKHYVPKAKQSVCNSNIWQPMPQMKGHEKLSSGLVLNLDFVLWFDSIPII